MDIEKYLPYICDPVDRNDLELTPSSSGTTSLLKNSRKEIYYQIVDGFPDLRPDRGFTFEELEKTGFQPPQNYDEVTEHYDRLPCHNYLDLDNVPTGKWLRSEQYNTWFEKVDFCVEIGCGKGAIIDAFWRERNVRLLGIDIAPGSIRHIGNEPLKADGIIGSNMAIPIKDRVADLVVSHAVIHHTPDPIGSFSEAVRILKSGGLLFFNTYNWYNPYRSWYFFFSPPLKMIRKIFGPRLGDFIIKYSAFLVYYLVLWVVLAANQRRYTPPDFSTSCDQFFDFFLTPFARFYTKEEILSLARLNNLELLEHSTGGWPQNGQSHFFWFRKK